MKKVMKSVEQGMKMGIVRSDVRVTALSGGNFGEITYLDRVETPGQIKVVDVEDGLFTFEGEMFKLDMSEDNFNPQTMENCFEEI